MTTKLRCDVRPSFDLCQAPRGGNDGFERVLIGSRLTRASLRQVVLTGASLDDADFSGTDLNGSPLDPRRLRGSDPFIPAA